MTARGCNMQLECPVRYNLFRSIDFKINDLNGFEALQYNLWAEVRLLMLIHARLFIASTVHHRVKIWVLADQVSNNFRRNVGRGALALQIWAKDLLLVDKSEVVEAKSRCWSFHV